MGTWARGRRRGNVAAATLLKARGPGALFPRGFGFRRRGAPGTLFERRADKTAVGVSRVYERAAARRRQLNYEFLQATRKIVVPATNRWALVVDTAALRALGGGGGIIFPFSRRVTIVAYVFRELESHRLSPPRRSIS